MTTYQKGHEPAGAPVTYTLDAFGFVDAIRFANGDLLTKDIDKPGEADAIARLAHAAAEWRKLAEASKAHIKASVEYGFDDEGEAWLRRFDAMKETFGD